MSEGRPSVKDARSVREASHSALLRGGFAHTGANGGELWHVCLGQWIGGLTLYTTQGLAHPTY